MIYVKRLELIQVASMVRYAKNGEGAIYEISLSHLFVSKIDTCKLPRAGDHPLKH